VVSSSCGTHLTPGDNKSKEATKVIAERLNEVYDGGKEAKVE